jgi:hypothetical protein
MVGSWLSRSGAGKFVLGAPQLWDNGKCCVSEGKSQCRPAFEHRGLKVWFLCLSPEFAGFSGFFRGFRTKLANLARFGSPYLNVAT